jgi:hypothetical protein
VSSAVQSTAVKIFTGEKWNFVFNQIFSCSKKEWNHPSLTWLNDFFVGIFTYVLDLLSSTVICFSFLYKKVRKFFRIFFYNSFRWINVMPWYLNNLKYAGFRFDNAIFLYLSSLSKVLWFFTVLRIYFVVFCCLVFSNIKFIIIY